MVQWVIWYADGSSFSNIDGKPEDAPRAEVICIAAYSGDHGRMIWHATDYYIWETQWGGEWISVDREGLSDYLDRPGSHKIRLRGRHVPPSVFHAIYNKANTGKAKGPNIGRDLVRINERCRNACQ